MTDLEQKFEQDMHDLPSAVFARAKKNHKKYFPSYFNNMLSQMSGLRAAKKVINQDVATSGFIKIWECHALDLSVEAHVIMDKYFDLFTEEERQLCRERLTQYNFFEEYDTNFLFNLI